MISAARLGARLLIGCALAACGSENERSSRSTPSSDAKDETSQRPSGPQTTDRQLEGSCENFSLQFGPATLPPASLGAPYEVRLRDYADRQWSGVKYSASDGAYDFPAGFELPDPLDPVLRGVPTSAGTFEFAVLALHGLDSNGCSTMPDPHTFRIEVVEADGGSDAGADAN